MKHVIAILITLILTYICMIETQGRPFGILYLPLIVAMFGWGLYLAEIYSD